jgi:hypothetical protein
MILIQKILLIFGFYIPIAKAIPDKTHGIIVTLLGIGKLNYLAQNKCPDISYAVHQCAHFSTNPSVLHEIPCDFTWLLTALTLYHFLCIVFIHRD